MDPALLAILACPKCQNPLDPVQQEQAEGLCCRKCSLVYPIEEGIPVLLAEEGIPLRDWNAGERSHKGAASL